MQESLTVLVPFGLDFDPAKLNALQQFLAPFVFEIQILWWVLWVFVLCFVVTKYLVLPLVYKTE